MKEKVDPLEKMMAEKHQAEAKVEAVQRATNNNIINKKVSSNGRKTP
jgi:hypothetical protein